MGKMKHKVQKNDKFGKLTAIKYDNINYKPGRWKCKCECGNIIYVRTALLNNGQVKSCGCARGRKSKNSISKNPYYQRFIHYNKRHGYEFNDINEYIIYKKEKEKLYKTKPVRQLRLWWKFIKNDQNGDFKNFEDFCSWCFQRGYDKDCFTVRKRHRKIPYSKKNIQFGIYYNSKFISAYNFARNHFKYDRNKKLFYGYIKFKGSIKMTDKYPDFTDMLSDYCHLYKTYFSKDFILR